MSKTFTNFKPSGRHYPALTRQLKAQLDQVAGKLPRKQLGHVQAWVELRRDELMADWQLAVNGETPYKIDPL